MLIGLEGTGGNSLNVWQVTLEKGPPYGRIRGEMRKYRIPFQVMWNLRVALCG